ETARVLRVAEAVARLDVLAAFAELAAERNYARPVLDDSDALLIREGRHPVVEDLSEGEPFVPNDAEMDAEARRLLILTGPNMGGKSTYLRQVALIALLAHVGAFVPAAEARLGLVDRIFTRVGASDNLSRGLSTFMVEMTETANILNTATRRSLIVLDEVGRGTSTFDGVSIAWAVAEHVAAKIRARTLFATHYHELTELADTQDGVVNLSVSVREWNERIVFLRRIVEGPSPSSYGIQVARLAGLPREVIERAKAILKNLEAGEYDREGSPRPAGHGARKKDRAGGEQLALFAKEGADPVRRELESLDLLRLTPLEAMLALQRLQEMLKR
ncbi:MAG: DNA mismatch repair protein MutS, partial [Candidatus Methylomirabilis sp.]|nr:DNA mismatch repair protein MutS [Deltaproteobacteria bacterium]